jgi:predicted glycoside hydrolase/deacetylase ChbG (UPF0249 family)
VTRRLVVTGDDFGASPSVNEAIVRAHTHGILTSASLMVTGAAFDEAVALARRHPGLSTGLHLVFCDARPASPPETIPDLVNGDGRLASRPGPTGIAHAIFWRQRREQLEREIRAQFERYADTGLPFDHVDGHHHLHMHPFLFDQVARCMDDYTRGRRGVGARVPWTSSSPGPSPCWRGATGACWPAGTCAGPTGSPA